MSRQADGRPGPTGLALAALLLAQQTGAAVVVEAVEVTAGRQPGVRIRCSGPVSVRAQALPARGGEPDRILVDLVGAVLDPRVRGVVTGPWPLRRVRPDQLDPATVRLTLELDDPAAFTVRGDRLVVITLAPAPAGAAEPPVVPPVERPALPPSRGP